jgi:hypothetical protein
MAICGVAWFLVPVWIRALQTRHRGVPLGASQTRVDRAAMLWLYRGLIFLLAVFAAIQVAENL